jgi:hypothetical protein
MSLDSLPGVIDSATASVTAGAQAIGSAVTSIADSASSILSSGPVAALGSIANTVSGLFSSITSAFKGLGGQKLPLANPLFAYATWDYVLGIAILDKASYNSSSYITSNNYQLICKSANAQPNNRVNTKYGKFDFYINNVVLQGNVGFQNGVNSNIKNISFDIIEPYSMGMFMLACETAAFAKGYTNWKDCPYLLTIEFRGNTETGQLVNIPKTTRKLPFKFQLVTMKVTEKGSVYNCSAFIANDHAHAAEYVQHKSDVSVSGKTVQEVLQTGEKSLQVVANARFKKMVEDKVVQVADEIVIMFPADTASGGSAQGDQTENNTGPTQSSNATSADSVSSTLGLTRSSTNQTLVQAQASCNQLGLSNLNFDETKKGDPGTSKENVVYDTTTNVNTRAKMTTDPKVSEFKFSQDSDIINSINQVMMKSEYIRTALDQSSITADGFRPWWRIDTQVYHIGDTEKATGKEPKLIVYRVIPYLAHVANVAVPNVPSQGIAQLKTEIVKQYNYIYTGKNVDVLKFDIEYSASFATAMAANPLTATADEQRKTSQGGTKEQKPTPSIAPLPPGTTKAAPGGVDDASTAKFSLTTLASQLKGGGGPDSQLTQAARLFHDAICDGTDMIQLNMEIIGDPYYIIQSGSGNYTSSQASLNLNTDSTMNYQNGEVHIQVNFRSPTDINQSTGLYNNISAATTPAPFTGVYKVVQVECNFKDGKFTNTLMGNRLRGQGTGAGAASTFNISNVNLQQTADLIKSAVGQ